MTSQATRCFYPFCVFLTFALVLALRIGGMPFGEPFVIDADEPHFVRRAVNILATGDPNPHWFGHPGTLTIYNLVALYALKAWAAGVPFDQLLVQYQDDPAPFHALGKHLMIFWSLLGHFGLWLLTLQFSTRWVALLAVLLMAVAGIDIRIASLIRTDTQQSALLIFLFLCLIQGIRTRKDRWFLGAGLLLGLSTATKWPSAVVSLVILLAVFVASPGASMTFEWSLRRFRIAVIAGVLSLAALFLVAPHIFLDFGTVLHDLRAEAPENYPLVKARSTGFFPTLGYYFAALDSSLSTLGLGLAAVGMISGMRGEMRRLTLIPLSFFWIYLVFISSLVLKWERWLVPLIPPLCLFGALGTKAIYDLALARNGKTVGAFLVGPLLSAALTLGHVPRVVQIVQNQARPTRNVTVSRWITSNLPPGSRILSESYGPYLPRGPFELHQVDVQSGKMVRVAPTSRYVEARGNLGRLKDVPSALANVDYVIVTSYKQKFRKDTPDGRKALRVYDRLKRETELVERFGTLQVRKVRRKDGRRDEGGEGR